MGISTVSLHASKTPPACPRAAPSMSSSHVRLNGESTHVLCMVPRGSIRPKMALSDYTKIAFVRGLGTSACQISTLGLLRTRLRMEFWRNSRFSPYGVSGGEWAGISQAVLDSWRADHYKGRIAPPRQYSALDTRTLGPAQPRTTTPWVSFAKTRSSLPRSLMSLEHRHPLRNWETISWRMSLRRPESWTRLKSKG